MIEHILVPLDGSTLAERALPWAKAVAGRPHAHITLYQTTGQLAGYWFDPPTPRLDLEAHIEAYLSQQAELLQAQGVACDRVVGDEAAGPGIVAAAARQKANMIVMSTHGRSGLRRRLYGSVADYVLRHASVPILLVTAASIDPPMADGHLRVLLALDGSELAEAALPVVATLGQTVPTTVSLLRVVEPPAYATLGEGAAYVAYDPEAERLVAHRYLDDIAERLRAQGLETHTKVSAGLPAQEILAASRADKTDLVALATHGRGGVARMMFGSVAEAVLHGGLSPILLVRPSLHRAAADEGIPATERRGTPSPVGPPVDLVLSRPELGLVELGLRRLLQDFTRQEQHLTRPLLTLLARVSHSASRASEGKEGGTRMSCRDQLVRYIEAEGVAYRLHKHRPTYTAQEEAQAEHVPGRRVAKVVMALADSRLLMLALPADRRVDQARLPELVGSENVRLAHEYEFTQVFGVCEVGAMPALGNLYGVPVYLEEALASAPEITFPAGTHTESLTLAYADYERLARPVHGQFSTATALAEASG